MTPETVIRKIQQALSPDLLKPDQRKRLGAFSHPTTGHCYVASEALYHLYGKARGYKPHWIRLGDNTHWFLKNEQGRVLDPTREQFQAPVNYKLGKSAGFLTGDKPSKRSVRLMERIGRFS